MNLGQPEVLWDVAAQLGEGPMWHAPTQSLYFVDIKGRRIHRCAADGTARTTWPAPNQATCIVPIEGGGLACTLRDGLYRFDERDGGFSLISAVERDVVANRFNDGYVDASGRLWFGSMHDAEIEPDGALYHCGPDGAAKLADPGYIITNGPAMSPDGSILYHTDTLSRTIYAFDTRPGGELANKRRFVSTAAPGYPDGMAVDADGYLWVAMFRGHRIDRYCPAGQLVHSVAFPVPNITKLAFGGDDLRTAYVTTAWKGLSDSERAQYPLAGALFAFRSATPGLPQHEFKINHTETSA